MECITLAKLISASTIGRDWIEIFSHAGMKCYKLDKITQTTLLPRITY